jgi:hypothetical protein
MLALKLTSIPKETNKQTNKQSNQASKKGETITDQINRVSVCYHALYQSPSFNPGRGKEGENQMHPPLLSRLNRKTTKEGRMGGEGGGGVGGEVEETCR